MYDFMQGKILQSQGPRSGLERLTLLINDIGYTVHVALRLIKKLNDAKQDHVALWIYHVINADQGEETLYGFATVDERTGFCALLEIKGLGPVSAMKILSNTTLDELCQLVKDRNLKALKAIPGVGPKTAERIITEFKL